MMKIGIEPSMVPLNDKGEVRVATRAFPRTIGGASVTIKCHFGTFVTNGRYESSYSVKCAIPTVELETTVELGLSIVGGQMLPSSSTLHVRTSVICNDI